MLQKDIFEKFKILFPMYSQAVTTWFPNGKGSIRVRLGEVNGDFVFTFRNNNEWKFETVNSFINNTLKSKEIK